MLQESTRYSTPYPVPRLTLTCDSRDLRITTTLPNPSPQSRVCFQTSDGGLLVLDGQRAKRAGQALCKATASHQIGPGRACVKSVSEKGPPLIRLIRLIRPARTQTCGFDRRPEETRKREREGDKQRETRRRSCSSVNLFEKCRNAWRAGPSPCGSVPVLFEPFPFFLEGARRERLSNLDLHSWRQVQASSECVHRAISSLALLLDARTIQRTLELESESESDMSLVWHIKWRAEQSRAEHSTAQHSRGRAPRFSRGLRTGPCFPLAWA